jgi:hypothetical protein
MKKFLFAASFFFAGLSIGIGLMFWVIWEGPDQVIAQEDHSIVTMNVVYATLLHDQKYTELNRLLETDMVASLNTSERMDMGDEPQSSAQLVRGHYNVTGAPIPSEISGYVSSVKGSDVRRLADAMTPPAHQ